MVLLAGLRVSYQATGLWGRPSPVGGTTLNVCRACTHHPPVVHTACCPYQQGFGSASPSDTSEDQEDRSLGQGRSLPAGARALREAPAAAGSKGWDLRTAARASSLPGPLGSEAAEQKRETLGKSSVMMMRSLSTGQCSKNLASH